MNIILIIFDSLRKDCIEYLGSPPWGKIYTPNLNKFASNSIVLDRCYPESLPTLPARRSIYTGKRIFPFKGEDNGYKGDFYVTAGWGPINEERITLSEVLQKNGYTTALISDIQHMFKPSKNFHRGFDEWVWIRGYEADSYRSGPTISQKEIDYWLPKELQDNLYISFLSQCLRNFKGITNEEDYSVAKVMREAVRWLEQNVDKEKKFILIESWAPHEPWFIPSYYKGIYINNSYPEQVLSLYRETTDFSPEIIKSTQANYSGLVTMCDHWFGYLIDSISKLDMLDNTLIIVTTDHGHSIGDNGYLGKRGYPSTPEVYDIPIIMRLPGSEICDGRISNILCQHIDIMPTILDIIGISMRYKDSYQYKWDDGVEANRIMKKNRIDKNKDIKLDGKSFFRTLLNGEKRFRDHVTVAWGSNITVIDDNWWLNCKVNGKGAFLFDLSNINPFENNVATRNRKKTKELFKLALKDANGNIPDFLIEIADKNEDAPGCSDLALSI